MKALSEMMVEFWDEGEHHRDQQAFRDWQMERENYHGFVLNYPPDDLIILHKARCPHIKRHSNPAVSLAENRKVCSNNTAELLAYAGVYGEDWRRCETCEKKRHDDL